MIYVFLAEGFEEIEALIPVDVLRRGGVTVKTVGLGLKTVVGAHAIPVVCDLTESEVVLDKTLEGIVLPGGMPGTLNLEKSSVVNTFIDYAVENNLLVSAICAAPSILGHKGLLNGRSATCYPGFEKDLTGASTKVESVVKDGNFITAKGPGAAADFAFELLKYLKGDKKAEEIKQAMCYE